MSMSDALLRAIHWWITSYRYSMKTRCFISLQAVEPISRPLTRCLGVLTNIPVFAFFPWTVRLSRTVLAMLDWLSYNWLLAHFICQEMNLNWLSRWFTKNKVIVVIAQTCPDDVFLFFDHDVIKKYKGWFCFQMSHTIMGNLQYRRTVWICRHLCQDIDIPQNICPTIPLLKAMMKQHAGWGR